jgi:hypothetical protein
MAESGPDSVLAAVPVLVDQVSESVVSGSCRPRKIRHSCRYFQVAGSLPKDTLSSQTPVRSCASNLHQISLSRIYGMSCGITIREAEGPVLADRP